MTVRGSNGQVLFSSQQKAAGLSASSPNGEACGPTCYTTNMTFTMH
jgi:hypothetical protein